MTIIVMLILVAVTVTVALNGGLFSSAKKATADTEAAREAESELSNGQVNIDNTIYNSIEEYVASKPPKTAAELFDESKEKLSEITGKDDSTIDGNLHIGDFINYHAGNWTDAEIKAIQTGENGELKQANGTKYSLPNSGYQFGGFSKGDSRDGNAKPYDGAFKDLYAKFSNGEAITGWRLFDVDKRNNTITLISAGCPEDYYHPYGTKYGYISEYILSGNVNSKATELSLTDSYTKRNWSSYINTVQHATSANAITKTDLDNWYKKYMEVNDDGDVHDDATFRKVYKTRYENLIDNYSYYWLASVTYSYSVNRVSPFRKLDDSNNYASGVRVLVTLPSNIQISNSSSVTVKKMVDDDDHGGPYTYNVWDIK